MSTIAAVLLAAGRSSRMGRDKPLLPWLHGQTLIAYQANTLCQAGFSPVIVVLGHAAQHIRPAVPDLPGVTVAEHPDYTEGRATSVVRGIREVPADVGGVLVLNVDSPRPAETLRHLKEAFESARPLMAVLSHKGEIGHPWLFSIALIPELLTISEKHQGLREVEERYADQVLLVEDHSPLVLSNVNTVVEYEETLAQASEEQDGLDT
jgi:molybdenum cofactor cytidylyltransferase